MRSQEFNLATRNADTTKLEDIFGCILEIEAQPNQNEWLSFLQNNLQLDSAALDTIPAGSFTVIAQFVINKDGRIEEISIVKDPGYGIGELVKTVLNDYDGRWRPAIFNGRETKSYRRQPITFIVEEEMEDECEEEQVPGLIF